MHRTCIAEYKKAELGWPHPVLLPLFQRMNVSLIIHFFLIFLLPVTGQRADYQPFHDWMIVASNSSGRLLFDLNPKAPRVFALIPYNVSVRTKFFYERPPKIILDPPKKVTSGTDSRFVPPTSLPISSEALKTATEEVPSAHRAGRHLHGPSKHEHEALEVSNTTPPAEVSKGISNNLLFHASEMAKMIDLLNDKRQAPNLTVPHRESKPFKVTQASNDTIVYAIDEVSLTKESSRLYHICSEQERARRQITPDITTELDLSDS